jgi:hypothetical protein
MDLARRSAPDAPAGPTRRLLRWLASPTGVALLAVLVVAGVGAAISYSHMLDWARANGDTGDREWRAYLFPVSVDGAIIAASAIIYADARVGRPADWLAYLVVAVGMGQTVTANVAHDWVDGRAELIIAGWPALAVAGGTELVFRFVRRIREHDDTLAEAQRQAELDRLAAEREAAEAEQKAEEARQRRREREESKRQQAAEAEPDAEVVRLRADGADSAQRPAWLAKDATAEQAMRAYLAQVNPEASGADLDRAVGVPYFGTAPGYGRKIARAWRAERDERKEQEA